MSKRKEVNMSKSPFENLQQIEARKQQLRLQIERQEEILGQDYELYQDDVDALKNVWTGVKGVYRFGQNVKTSTLSRISQVLPIGESKTNNQSSKINWFSVINVATEVVGWVLKRRRKKKEA